jgi:hypothetical protein
LDDVIGCTTASILGRDPAWIEPPWSELQIQSYIIQESRRAGYLVAGDQNAGKRNPGAAAASGILAGAPVSREDGMRPDRHRSRKT